MIEFSILHTYSANQTGKSDEGKDCRLGDLFSSMSSCFGEKHDSGDVGSKIKPWSF